MNCNHEVDWDNIENGDCDDMRKYKDVCVKTKCKKCGCEGTILKDGDEYWTD